MGSEMCIRDSYWHACPIQHPSHGMANHESASQRPNGILKQQDSQECVSPSSYLGLNYSTSPRATPKCTSATIYFLIAIRLHYIHCKCNNYRIILHGSDGSSLLKHQAHFTSPQPYPLHSTRKSSRPWCLATKRTSILSTLNRVALRESRKSRVPEPTSCLAGCQKAAVVALP